MPHLIDAAANQVPVFGVDAVMETEDGVTWGLIVHTINWTPNGEMVAAKNGDGDDVTKIYYNRDLPSVSMHCIPVASDETLAIGVTTHLKMGDVIRIVSSTKSSSLPGYWSVQNCANSYSNVDVKSIDLDLTRQINQAWPE